MRTINLFFIILFSISCTYKGNLSEVNYIKKRYRLSDSYYDPYDKYYRYNWKKRAISNITEYDSLGFVTDYCRAISDDYIYFSKDTTKWNTNPFEEYMNYHIVIDKKNNYIIDHSEFSTDTIRDFEFVRGKKQIVTPIKKGIFLLFEYE